MRNLFTWDESFSVKITILDQQHQGLFSAINEFYQALQEKKPKEGMLNLLEKLKKYTVTHFATEEKLMQKHQYPGFITHKAEHEAFIARVNEWHKLLEEGKLVLAFEISKFLKGWLENHIRKMDKMYSSYLTERGER